MKITHALIKYQHIKKSKNFIKVLIYLLSLTYLIFLLKKIIKIDKT